MARSRHLSAVGRGQPSSAGFTLIELVVVMALLVVVLITTYKILHNCLATERQVSRAQQPEKVGEAIISLVRRDLLGAFYKGLSEQLDYQVFTGIDRDSGDGPQDQVYFLTTVEPTPREDIEEYDAIRAVTVVGYYLEPNRTSAKYSCYTLYRKEVTDLTTAAPLDAPGRNFVIYDKVKSLSIEYHDGYEWLLEWSSEREVADMEALVREEEDLAQRRPERIGRVSDEEDAAAAAEPAAPLTRTPLPRAVRVGVEIYAGEGREVNEERGEPVIRRFATVVPLIAGQSIAMELEDPAEAAALDDAADGVGAGGGSGTSGASGPGGGGRDRERRRGGPGTGGTRGERSGGPGSGGRTPTGVAGGRPTPPGGGRALPGGGGPRPGGGPAPRR